LSEHPSDNITHLLIELSNGDRAAVDLLLPVIYDELRKLAANYLRRERPDHTLQPTALVHEAYIRLIDQSRVNCAACWSITRASTMPKSAARIFKNSPSTKTSIELLNEARN
jgi:ECF sigma factor